MQVVEEECPKPKSGEVRVKVLAAGVSLPNVLAREGVVDQIGEGVSAFELFMVKVVASMMEATFAATQAFNHHVRAKRV